MCGCNTQCVAVVCFNTQCVAVVCFNTQCVAVVCFNTQCVAVVCYNTQCVAIYVAVGSVSRIWSLECIVMYMPRSCALDSPHTV